MANKPNPANTESTVDDPNAAHLDPAIVALNEQRKNGFVLKAQTLEEEQAFDFYGRRRVAHPIGFVGTVANVVKGALGAGILSTHVAYKKGGAATAGVANIIIGIYITYCYWILAASARTVYRRTHLTRMTYADLAQASCAIFPNNKVKKCAKLLRHTVDALVIVDLFGSCCTYQLIISKTIKQLVEDTQTANVHATKPGYPNLRVYLACMIIPMICICLLRHLKNLAPLSMFANGLVVFCVGVTIYYAMTYNSKFENLQHSRGLTEFFEFAGMIVFSMSCIGVILPAENNISEPKQYFTALITAMVFVVSGIFISGFFGYVAFLEKSVAPITMNYPMELLPKILKGLMAFMVYVTHAVNFWVPFELVFHYISLRIKDKSRIVLWEYFYRAVFCLLISLIAITFPSVSAIMGFLGCFCLANLIFVIPNCIHLMVIWDRPGLGTFKWRFIQWIFITIIGMILFAAGSYVNGRSLIKSIFSK